MKTTQAQRLYAALRRKPHTTMELLALGVSVCPWRRLTEGLHYLRPGEKLLKGERDGRVTYRVVKG